MLKKSSHIILAFILLVSTTGVSLSKHYCGTRFVSYAINSTPESCCEDMGSMNCCHNETEEIKLTEDFLSIVVLEEVSDFGIDILFHIVFDILQNQTNDAVVSTNFFPDIPPPKIQTVLSKIQVYLI